MLNEILKKYKLIDLTHTLHTAVPTWDGTCGFKHEINKDYTDGCRTYSINMQAGIGTHMDAPSHFIPDGISISDIPIEKLIVPVCVIDISLHNNPKYMLSVSDIELYEKKFTKIPENSLVIAYTGWDKYWTVPNHYRNANSEGHLQFPGFSAKAAELLVERNIAGIGIDTLSPDGSDMTFPVHHIILGSGRYIIENLCNCDKLPAMGAYVIALPLKTQFGTESAMRVVGLIPTI